MKRLDTLKNKNMKCLMLVTYSFNQEYIAVPCDSEDEAKECIKKHISDEIKRVEEELHYTPITYSETDDNVTLLYTSENINLDTNTMECRVVVPGHGVEDV